MDNQPGIIFCNYRDSIERVSEFLKENNIPHGCFFGTMEQRDRERSLIKFRNGTHRLIVATDLAARGIDVPEIKFIIHYHLPNEIFDLKEKPLPKASYWSTLFISGGRKDKISKGDIAGLFFKQANLKKDELGVIELKQDCAFVAVPTTKVKTLIKQFNPVKLKTKKVKISLA